MHKTRKSCEKQASLITDQELIILSACLAGHHCRHDGGNKKLPHLADKVRRGEAIPLCPEQLGGLPTPRRTARIQGGDGFDVVSGRARVVDAAGQDVTEQFLRGAREVLKLARDLGAVRAVLCEGSPSCGVEFVHIGEKKVKGMGVCAALLFGAGIEVAAAENES